MKFRSEEAMAAYSKKHNEAVEKVYKMHFLDPNDPKNKDKPHEEIEKYNNFLKDAISNALWGEDFSESSSNSNPHELKMFISLFWKEIIAILSFLLFLGFLAYMVF